MKKLILLSLLLIAGCTSASQDPVKVWESQAVLNMPESVLFDEANQFLYVANINGEPNEKNGLGFITRLNMDGQVDTLHWSEGFNAPKGMAIVGDQLYIADVDKLVRVDLATGQHSAEFPADGAIFLNDVTADSEGRVYVSDLTENRIYRLTGETIELWIEGDELENPNGLFAVGDTLYLGSWGKMTNGFETEIPGRIKLINLNDQSISDYAGTDSVGNIDGLMPINDDTVLITDWMAGGLLQVTRNGGTIQLLDLEQGSADMAWNAKEKLIYIPMMMQNKVVAYKLQN